MWFFCKIMMYKRDVRSRQTAAIASLLRQLFNGMPAGKTIAATPRSKTQQYDKKKNKQHDNQNHFSVGMHELHG